MIFSFSFNYQIIIDYFMDFIIKSNSTPYSRIDGVLDLPKKSMVIKYGYETLEKTHPSMYKTIRQSNNITALWIRLQPDYLIVLIGGNPYFVEVKSKMKYVEAMQLILNKNRQFPVKYYFKPTDRDYGVLIDAKEIPVRTIVVPHKYRKIFETLWKSFILHHHPRVKFSYIDVTRGSQDPFIAIDIVEIMRKTLQK